MKMVNSGSEVAASCQIYRSVEIRPKILMRADSVPATYFPSTTSVYRVLDSEGGERAFRVSCKNFELGETSEARFSKFFT